MSYDWGLPCSEERSFTPRFHDHCHSPHIISIPIPLPLDYYSPCLLSRVPFASILTRKDIHPFCRLNDQIRESLCAWSVVGFDNFEGVLKLRWILLRVDSIIQNIFLSLKMILSECNVGGLLISKSKYRLESEIRILRMLIIIENSRNLCIWNYLIVRFSKLFEIRMASYIRVCD